LRGPKAAEGIDVEGVSLSTGLVLTIQKAGGQRLDFQLTPEGAVGLGEVLMKMGKEIGERGFYPVSSALATWNDAEGYPVTLCSEGPIRMGDGSLRALDLSSLDMPSEITLAVEHRHGPAIGIVRKLEVRGDRLVGLAYFAQTTEAQQVRRDVDVGVFPCVSVGYHIEQSEPIEGGWKITKWRLHEVSVCRNGGDPNATIRPPGGVCRGA
jgi:hypothetical protein